MNDTRSGLRRLAAIGSAAGLVIAGAVGLATPAAATTGATLFEPHENTTAADFGSEGSCPNLEDGQDGWHFVLRGNETTFVSLTASFDTNGDGDSDTDISAPGANGTIGPPTAKHAYIYSPIGATLVTAAAQVNGPETIFNLSHTCPGDGRPPVLAPDITKTAETSYTKTWDWDVDKDVDESFVTSTGTTHTADYTLDVDRSGPALSAFVVEGTITISNPNTSSSLQIVDVTETLEGCTPDPLFTVLPFTLEPKDETSVEYSCSIADATPTTTGTNEVEVTWLPDPNPDAVASKIEVSDPVVFDFADADVTKVNECADLTDTLKGDLGNFCDDDTVEYSLDFDVPARGCAEYDNTATVTYDTGSNSSSASVTICRPYNDGGFTIGYWQNKNGQAFIKANSGAVTSAIGTYYYKPATNPVDKFVLDIVKAPVSQDPIAMLDKQYLATILSTVKSPDLLDTCIQVGPHGVSSVEDFLLDVKANYASISTDATHREGVKDIFDNLNNNKQPVYACD